MPDTLATSLFMAENKANRENLDTIRYKLLNEYGIKTSYDSNRVIFSTMHNQKNHLQNIYAQECNGLILEMDTWKPLMVPARSLRFNINTDASNGFLHKGLYHIYKVEDGTCFNMYFYDGKWVISTAKGYEMNDVVWESKTYKEIISECLSKLETPMTWEDFTSKLSENCCYSFGFKHPTFHHFFEGNDTPIYRLWFIQSIDLNKDNDKFLWATDKTPVAEIKSQEYYTSHINSLRDLYKIATDADKTFLETGEICYGFILRSVNFETTTTHSDLFIESSLMRIIRKTWYDNTIIDLCHKRKWPKELVITLNSYLNSDTYETFRYMFPHYAGSCDRFSEEIEKMIEKILIGVLDTECAKYLSHLFKTTIKYDLSNKSDAQKKRVLMEFVVNPKMLEVLVPLFLVGVEA